MYVEITLGTLVDQLYASSNAIITFKVDFSFLNESKWALPWPWQHAHGGCLGLGCVPMRLPWPWQRAHRDVPWPWLLHALALAACSW